jgi:hypothetical protein
MNSVKSDFLLSTPSFASGAARLIDWYSFYDRYNSSPTGYEADYKALLSDWYVVGQDISSAIRQFDHLLSSGQIALPAGPIQLSLSYL